MTRRRVVPRERGPVDLGEGHEGPRVAGLQRVLNDLGFRAGDDEEPLVEDGRFGPVTARALGEAQRQLGVAGEDGYLGRATRAALRRRRDGAGTRRSRSVSAGREGSGPNLGAEGSTQ